MVKVTPVQTLRLCTGRTANRGSRGIDLHFNDHGTRRGWGGSASRPGRSLLPGKTRYLLYRRLGGAQGRSGRVRKISPLTGIRSPDRPSRNHSLYRLSYSVHNIRILLKHWDGCRRFGVLHFNCARRMTQICVFNTRLFSLNNTLNYAIHTACLRMVLLTDVYRNPTSLWINL